MLKWIEKKKMTSDLKYLSPASFVHNGRSLVDMNVHSTNEDPFIEDEDPIHDFFDDFGIMSKHQHLIDYIKLKLS